VTQIMKSFTKKIISTVLCLTMLISMAAFGASADNSRVVTMGANLTEAQKELMWDYFGVSEEDVVYIEVNNQQEREFLSGVASEETIGTRTLSCAYVEPTNEGGIKVKTANLTWVTSTMIANTLATSGIENCNVIAACPIEVSGTGALTGIMIAYEKATGETIDEDKKEAATEELIQTGELSEEIGQEEASDLVGDIKEEIIQAGELTTEEIEEVVESVSEEHNVILTEEQKQKLTELMEKISNIEYDFDSFSNALSGIKEELGKINESIEENKGFFENIWESIKSFFSGDKAEEIKEQAGEAIDSIFSNTNDAIFGDDAVIDATDDDYINENDGGTASDTTVEAEEELSLWEKIVNWFKNLFGGSD